MLCTVNISLLSAVIAKTIVVEKFCLLHNANKLNAVIMIYQTLVTVQLNINSVLDLGKCLD